ncbi:MAG: LysR family transcriptional regulator [Candidatus Krumholzibacteriota bacterium]|nr:LysR family transcriptional regulator [Candidatus Krumholzibacteriota bacterium]
MELRTLKYYLSLAERGSFTAAAKDHFVTQPAISIQLKKLQNELGTILFEIDKREIRFTEPGKIALDYSRRLVELEKEFVREMNDLEGLKKGKLLIGTIDAASIYVLPNVFSRFRERYPGIEVDLEISSTLPLLRDLENGKLDIVVGTLPVSDRERFEVFSVYDEELIPIASPDHPLASEGEVSSARFAEYPFICFQRESVTRAMIEELFRKRKIDLKITMAIDSQEAIRNLVISGLGLSILPEWTVRDQIKSGSLTGLKIRGLAMRREIGLIIPSGRYIPSTARAFLGVLKDEMGVDLPPRLTVTEGESR